MEIDTSKPKCAIDCIYFHKGWDVTRSDVLCQFLYTTLGMGRNCKIKNRVKYKEWLILALKPASQGELQAF